MAEFEVRRSSDDQYYFVLQADNNEIVATSWTYTRKQSCLEGIDVVKRIAPDATVNDTTN
ncbi:MAG: YegP family protein [Dehalococcoidia bacterium]